MYKLLTVDVWDTLLRRDCHPECIKLATAAYVIGFNERIVSSLYSSHWELYKIRNEIESSLADRAEALGFDREYEIVNVLDKWLSKICGNNYSKELAVKLAEYELNAEIEHSHVDHNVVDFIFKIPVDNRIFLSDFYMDSAMLNRLLNAKGLRQYFNGGLSSCDLNLNKRSGRLFKHVHQKYGIKPSEHMHMGDNQWSDVDCPKIIGINSLLYKPEAQHREREYLESLFSSRSFLFAEMMRKVNLIEPNSECCSSPKKNASFKLGLAMAPLFVGFILYVAETAVSDELDKICYLTREGEFFKKIHDRIFGSNSNYFGHKVPDAELLEVSRLSTFLPSLANTSVEEFARMWRIHGRQSIKGFFSTLGLRVEDFQELLDFYRISNDEVIVSPENDSRFIGMIQSESFVSVFESKLLDQRTLLLKYLKQKNIVDGMRIGLVDVGWRGSIQDNLANISKENKFYGYYLALKKFVEIQPHNVLKKSWLINELNGLDLIESKCLEAYAVIEMLCNSDSGSVVGYIDVDGVVYAEKYIDNIENNSFNDFTKYFQEGVLAATQLLHSYMNRYVVTPSEVRDLALNIWHVAGANPQKELVEIFMNSSQHDVFCFGDVFNRANVPSLGVILKAFFLERHRKALIHFVGRVQWTAAIKSMSNIGLLHRSILMAVFVAANFYRRCKVKIKNGAL